MDERVQKYLKIRRGQEGVSTQPKEEKLLKLGLFDKVYVPADEADGSTKKEYVDGETKYYKEVVWQFTDEEYRELEELEGRMKNKQSNVLRKLARFFLVVGILGMVIAGLITIFSAYAVGVGLVLLLVGPLTIYFSYAFVMVFLQMAEDMNAIKKKLYEK